MPSLWLFKNAFEQWSPAPLLLPVPKRDSDPSTRQCVMERPSTNRQSSHTGGFSLTVVEQLVSAEGIEPSTY